MLCFSPLTRRYGWPLGIFLAALLALSGCGGGASSNSPVDTGSTATSTPVANPTPARIAGWQTYSDTRYQFTIQYPPDWTAQQAPPSPDAASDEIINFFPNGSGAPPAQNVISITIAPSQANSVGDVAPPGFAPSGSVTVDGTSQTLLSGPGASGGQELLVLFANGNQVYLFASNADTANAPAFQRTFTQMLSTFQFEASY